MKQNYTKEQETRLSEVYAQCADEQSRSNAVSELAKELGKTEASVISKLSNMGIYQKKSKQDKTGNPITSKAELVRAIRIFSGVRDHELSSLEKASKQDLKRLLDVFRDLQNQFELKN